MFATFLALPESWLQGLNIYRGPRKRNYKKENLTECCFTQGISDAEEGFKTYRRNSPEGAECIHEYITVRKRDSNEDYEPSSLLSLMASFERYLRKKNYGFSIMKDAEFEQPRKALQIIRKETTNRNERQRRSILPRCKQLDKTRIFQTLAQNVGRWPTQT